MLYLTLCKTRSKEINVRAKLAVKTKAQVFLSHMKTLNPSSNPKGIRLKRAIQALKAELSKNTKAYGGTRKETAKNTIDNVMFIVGPATDIFPMFFLSAIPAIMTAPGDIILNNGETMETSVKTTPISVSLNSAHNPFLCAAILWAISCMKKDAVIIAVNTASMLGSLIWAKVNVAIPNDNPMPTTSNAAIDKCVISFLLKCTFPLIGSNGT